MTGSSFSLTIDLCIKAFAYLRVSGKGQVEGDGFTRQLEAIRKYATENDYIQKRQG